MAEHKGKRIVFCSQQIALIFKERESDAAKGLERGVGRAILGNPWFSHACTSKVFPRSPQQSEKELLSNVGNDYLGFIAIQMSLEFEWKTLVQEEKHRLRMK